MFNQIKTKKPLSLNMAFFLAVVSVLFCWFYGIFPLVAAIFSLRRLMQIRKGRMPSSMQAAFKLKWGYRLAWVGLGFSGIFTVYYLIAFATGAFVRW